MNATPEEPDPETGLPVGPHVASVPARIPGRTALTGDEISVEPLDPGRHGPSLWAALAGEDQLRLCRYLADGPFPSRALLDEYLGRRASTDDPLFFALVDQATGGARGVASYLRIEPVHGCIEVGHILLTPGLQRTRAATEAMYLMARHVFEGLGYRRYEWKCDSLNAPSRRAAERLGFTFEGLFRQHMVVKGRSRDTAWFSILDREWPARRARLERWLDRGNFDERGRQQTSLAEIPLN